MNYLFTIMVSLSVAFLWMKHPLSMGLILICQTLIIAMLTGMTLSYFLYSYIITIVMLSGALVLFIYMASIASNEKFQTPILLMILFITITMIIYNLLPNNEEMIPYQMSNNMNNMTMPLIKLYSTMSAYITIMMIFYLLITMIVVSNIAPTTGGPLRMKI
uniref:NADH dehydrogenase subunit 6 n=1 Tax=Cyclopelta parva TaxID=696241 RepID=A0A343W8W2_9HEMI|nr:NADH dehydrogenase subunit 6 [Cyclopelta parva]AVZ00802.1 NADH dehydrogenase subunit 6 [Cyclopelta parva]